MHMSLDNPQLTAPHPGAPVRPAGPVWPLAQLKRGASAQVVAVHESGPLGERLMEMGLTPGTWVRLVRCGMWGDPMQLELRGYMLSLRRAQARNIDVTPDP